MIDPQAPDFGNTPVSDARPVYGYSPDNPRQVPYVTVVTPFYNARATFHETAESLLRQSLQQWEWLIINDGSTSPEALELLEQYRRRDPRIRVIDHAKNAGLSAARNTGFRQARSEYVFLLDDDDLLEPTTLEKSCWFLESHPELSFVDAWSVGFGVVEYLWSEGFRRGEQFLSENVATSMALVRKCVHESVGGFDEAIRGGMEDWDFWLRCADASCWGATIPEYFGWYRRRSDHGDRWVGLAGEQRRREFRVQLQRRYPRLYEGGFPKIAAMPQEPFTPPRERLPCENPLRKDKPRLLMILPWLTMGGADKFNLDLLEQLTRRGWQVTIVTTEHGDNSWLPRAAAHTPDIFVLGNFLKPTDQPAFLRYLIDSRAVECVLISATELGYMLLPYLRAHCPQPVYIDYSHMEDETWRSGGYPRFAVGAQSQLDLNIVASEHLKEWMVQRGGEAERIEVAHINVDPDVWKPHPELRAELRYRFGWPADQPVILYAGRLCRQKQPHVFAQVMRALAEGGTGFGALAAGDGPKRDWLRGFVDEHGLGRHVRVLGAQSPEQMQKLMAASDIFFLPSRWEVIALTVYEAMACGLAVVGADVGGQRELVMPECGCLLPPVDEQNQIQRYAQELARLISQPTARAAMGRRARARVEAHFSLDAMGDRIVSLIAKAGQLKQTAPHVAISRALARESATQALELARLAAQAEKVQGELAAERDKLARTKAVSELMRRQWWWRAARRCARLLGVQRFRNWGCREAGKFLW